MHLATPQSAIMSAVIFNALVIIFLIPLALRGIKYRAVGASTLLRDHLVVYGLGGVVAPFLGIKAIDVLLVTSSTSPAEIGARSDARPGPRLAAVSLVALTLITGVAYPLLVTGTPTRRSPARRAGASSSRTARRWALTSSAGVLRRPQVLLGAPVGHLRDLEQQAPAVQRCGLRGTRTWEPDQSGPGRRR